MVGEAGAVDGFSGGGCRVTHENLEPWGERVRLRPDGFVVAGVVAAPVVLDGDAFVFTWRLAQAWVGCGAAGVVHASVPSFAGA